MEYEYKEPHKLKLKKIKADKPQDFHKISCPSCQNEILAADLNINDKIAKCGECNVVFSFQNTVNNLFSNPAKVKQEILRPEGIDIFHFKNELDFTIQQPYSVLEGILGGLAIPAALILTVAFIINGGPVLIPTLFFWLLSAYPIYSWITHSKNKMYVNIDEKSVNVQWKPRKGRKARSYDKTDIDQLYIKLNQMSGHHDVYMIVNGLEGQKHVSLLPSISSKSKALYLEQEIEKHLGIIDRAVLEESKV